MGKKRSFKIGEDIVDIPVEEVDKFLVDVPDATEVQSFLIGRDTVDIPLPEVERFKADVPDAKPLEVEPFDAKIVLDKIQNPNPQEQTLPMGLDSILPPVVAGRDPLNPNENKSFNPPPKPEPPTVELTRKQRDAITGSALKVPKDIRDNPAFGARYIKDVSARTKIPEQAVKQIYEQGVKDENRYIELKSQYDITPADAPEKDMQLHEMGQLLINLGRYDEAIEAYKGMEKRLFDQGISEYKPGMPPNYVDQKQIPAFIGVMNAVYGKGDMKEYDRLLKIAELKGVDLSGMPMVGGGDVVQPGNEMTYQGDQMVPVGTPDKGVKTRTEQSDYINSIADALDSLTGIPQSVEMTAHGAEKFGKYFKDEFMNPKRGWNPWSQYMVDEQGKERSSFSNYLGMVTGAVETAMAGAMASTPASAVVGIALINLPPEAQELIMPVSLLARKYYGEGNVPEDIENVGVLLDLVVAGAAHVGAKKVGKLNTKLNTMREVMREIEKLPEAEVRMLFEKAEQRYKESGLPPDKYAQEVLNKAKVIENEVRTIEDSMPVEPYNPEPAPESLRTVPEGVDVEYNGEIGKLDRGDDGTWYFVDGEGKSTQIKVEDKFNPTEKLTELGIQVMPEISKEAVARAVADREQVGEVEYKGKKYFVSLDNPMNESPTGDLVFERTADGRLLNRFDSHPDPVFAEQRKLAIVNKYLADKALPARSKLIEPWKKPAAKIEEPSIEPSTEPTPKTEPSTPVSAEIAPEDAVTLEGVIPVEEVAPVQEAKPPKPLTPAQEHKKLVRQAKMMTPVNFRQAVLQFVLSKGGSVSLADAKHITGFGAKDFPKFTVGKNGVPMHKVWERMKEDPDIGHLIPDDDHQFNNDFFDILTEYGKIDDMWVDLLKNAKEGEWRDMGFESPEAYERELMGRMEAAKEGIVYEDIPSELIDQIIKEVDQMPDEAVEQMLKDLDENAPKETYEEGTNTTTEEIIADSETRSPKGEDLYEIAREQQQRDALRASEEELAQAQKDFEKAQETLDKKRKVIDERIAEEQQQELFEAEKPENPLESEVDVNAREQALAKEKADLQQAKQRLKEAQGKRKAEALKKIDDFEQWALNLPGIKDMSGGASKAGIGASEVIKGITEVVRKAVEAGFDIADAVAEAIEKYKRISPEFFNNVTEDAILTRFGVEKEMFAAKNKATAEMREKMGIPQDVEVTAQNKRDFTQVMENAKKMRKEGVNPVDIAERVVRDGYMISAEEQHLLVENEIALYNERRALEKKINSIDPNKIEREQDHLSMFARLDDIQAEQGLMFSALERAGREQSLVFRMRQLAMDREYSVEAFKSNYNARTGKEPSDQEIKNIQRLQDEIRDTAARKAELEFKAKEEQMQGLIEDLKEELERERIRKQGGLTKEKQARKVELKKKFSGMFNDATNIPALLADKEFIEYAGLVIEETANDFKAFTRKLIEELGPKIEPHAKEIFDRANKRQYDAPYMEGSNLRIDTNLLKSVIEAGVKDHKDFLAKVHEIVKEEFPDIPEREVADAISGYGKTINPTLDAVTKELNSLKRDLRLASSLDDARKGKGVLRTGYRPPEYSDEQRRVMREIREELKKHPEDEASAQKKWTTALGKIKKTLENSIRDTQARIEALEQGLPVEAKERKRVQLDEEAQQLKEQLEDLKKRAKELEGPKTLTDEQLVQNAIASIERSEKEYNSRTQEIRETGTYTPTNKRTVSNPALDLAKAARDRAKEEFDAALATTDYPKQAATQKALVAAEDRLADIENKIARGDMSYRQKVMSLVDQNNPMLVAAKAKIKLQQDILKAMREASGEAEKHMQELWTTRKENNVKELQRKLNEKDYTKKVRKETPLTEEMQRLKAKEDRLKFDFEVAVERARLQARGASEKALDMIADIGALPKSLNASMDLSAVLRQGSILSARHPDFAVQSFVESLKQGKDNKRFEKWHQDLVNSDDYMIMKRSKLFLNEPNAKLTAMEEAFASKIANSIPGVGASNRAYSAYLNIMRVKSFNAFRDMLMIKGYKGDALQKELTNYAKFINDATGRGSLKFGKYNLEMAAPMLNAFMFSPRFVSSRFNILIRHGLFGLANSPRARVATYRALAQYGLAVSTSLYLLKQSGLAEVTTDPLSSDFGKARFGDVTWDFMSGLQQPYVLINRLMQGAYTNRRGERMELNDGNNLTYNDLVVNYLKSKSSPTLSMALAAGSGKFYDGEKFELSKLPEKLLLPLIIQDLWKMYGKENISTDGVNWSPQGAERVAKNFPALMLGVGVQYNPEEETIKDANFSPRVRELIKKHKYKPENNNDKSYYLDNKKVEMTDEQLEKIEALRIKYAGEIVNEMERGGLLKGLTQEAFDRKMNKYYNQALKKARNKVLPVGWKERKKITD